MAEYLFVGGPWDGQRREVPDVRVEPDAQIRLANEDGYYAYAVSVGSRCEALFVHESIKPEEALAALLANYRPPRVVKAFVYDEAPASKWGCADPSMRALPDEPLGERRKAEVVMGPNAVEVTVGGEEPDSLVVPDAVK